MNIFYSWPYNSEDRKYVSDMHGTIEETGFNQSWLLFKMLMGWLEIMETTSNPDYYPTSGQEMAESNIFFFISEPDSPETEFQGTVI